MTVTDEDIAREVGFTRGHNFWWPPGVEDDFGNINRAVRAIPNWPNDAAACALYLLSWLEGRDDTPIHAAARGRDDWSFQNPFSGDWCAEGTFAEAVHALAVAVIEAKNFNPLNPKTQGDNKHE